jgi:hypothetical protein
MPSRGYLFFFYKIAARFVWNNYAQSPNVLLKENSNDPNFECGSYDSLRRVLGRRCFEGGLGGVSDEGSFPSISTRGTLYARPWSEVVCETRTAFHAKFRALVIVSILSWWRSARDRSLFCHVTDGSLRHCRPGSSSSLFSTRSRLSMLRSNLGRCASFLREPSLSAQGYFGICGSQILQFLL